MQRVDEDGADALVQMRVPVNKFPDFVRYIVQRDMEIARVYGVAWDWRNIVKTPPWMEKILQAIKNFDGKAARVVIEDEEAENRVEIGEGFFDE